MVAGIWGQSVLLHQQSGNRERRARRARLDDLKAHPLWYFLQQDFFTFQRFLHLLKEHHQLGGCEEHCMSLWGALHIQTTTLSSLKRFLGSSIHFWRAETIELTGLLYSWTKVYLYPCGCCNVFFLLLWVELSTDPWLLVHELRFMNTSKWTA